MSSAARNPPSAAELLANSTVRRALDKAWVDSQADRPQHRREEGGWIYMNLANGAITTRRAPSGEQAAIDLNNPPIVDECVVVGKFHTHPNPSSEGWNPEPSASDLAIDERHGVPDLIRADDGTHVSGPDRRRGGLTGAPGYPL